MPQNSNKIQNNKTQQRMKKNKTQQTRRDTIADDVKLLTKISFDQLNLLKAVGTFFVVLCFFWFFTNHHNHVYFLAPILHTRPNPLPMKMSRGVALSDSH